MALLTLAALIGLVRPAQAQIIADSILDYSSVQGQDGWSYGFYAGPFDPSGFQQMPIYGNYNGGGTSWTRSTFWTGGYWSLVGASDFGHPNGVTGNSGAYQEVNYVVRRWVSSFAGPAIISARLRKENVCCGGNGVAGHLWVKGIEVWSPTVEWWDSVGVTRAEPVCLSLGDVIEFALDPRDGHDGSDGSVFGFTVSGPFAEQPTPRTVCPAAQLTFTVGSSPGFQYQWQYLGGLATDWIDLVDGPNTVGGHLVLNAAGATTSSLTVDRNPAGWQVPGRLRCTASVACGSAVSEEAALKLAPDMTTGAIPGQPGYGVANGVVDSNDFFYYLVHFVASDVAVADLTTGATAGQPGYGIPDGVINNDDFFYYLAIFAAGC